MGTLQCKRPLTHTYTHHFISATSTVTGSEWIATICNIALTDTLPKGRPFFAGPPERKTSASLCVFNPTITHDIIQSVRHLTSGCNLFYTFSLHTPTLCCRAFCTCTRGRKLSLFVESLEECSNRPGKESPTTNFARLTTVFLSFGSILFLGILFLFVIVCASHQLGLSYVSLGKPIGFAEVAAAAAARYRLLMWRERLILCCQRWQSEQSERKREIVENEQSCTANTAFPAARDYVSGGNVMLWQQRPWWEYLVTFRSSAGVAREE